MTIAARPVTTASTDLATPAHVDEDARTITGRIVPFGQVGRTSSGRMTFEAGSLTWTDPSRVKLLIEHDHNRTVGHATSIEATADGYVGTFAVEAGPLGDAALAQAASRSRDGISIGVELDDESQQIAARNRNRPTPGRGALRECSLVAVPAFDDARVTAVGATPAAPLIPTAAHTVGETMPRPLTTTSTPTLTTGNTTPDAVDAPETVEATAETPTTASSAPTQPAQPAPLPAPAPALVAPATVSDAAVYSFTGDAQHSMILDMFAAQDGNVDAADRLAAFRSALSDDQSQQTATFAAAIATTAGDPTTAAVDVRDASSAHVTPDGYRPDMILHAIDKGRPFASRVRSMPITGPNPFRLPVVGDFDGVGAHTEGTSHVEEGTIDLTGQTVTPRAVSGAYRLSRELAESTGPRIDALVLPEIVKDYRREGEAYLVATLQVAKPAADATVAAPDDLDAQLIEFYGTRHEAPTVLGMGSTAYTTFATAKATDGRPYYPFLNPTNAGGATGAAFMSMNVQGVPGVLAWPAAAGDVWMVNGEDVVLFESAPRTFRFEEVEGPGIIKLALWGYQAAHVFRSNGVRRLTVGA